jgi:hypothetical protein
MIQTPRAIALAGLLALSLGAGGCEGCRKRTRFSSRGDAAAVVVVAQRGADDLGALPEEVEPNNTVAAAQLLPFTGDPLVAGVSGAVAAAGKTADADVFKLVIPGLGLDAGSEASAPTLAARRLAVELRPDADLSPVIQLLDAAGKQVELESASAGERAGFPNIAVAPGGTYFLRVRGSKSNKPPADGGVGRGGYRLAARVVDFEVGDEREPNDRAAEATELGGAHTSPEVAGYLGWRGDEDWYRLPVEGLPAGTLLDLELDGVEGVSAGLSLHDGAAATLASAKGRRGERVVLRNLALGPAALAAAGRDAAAGGRAVYVVVRTDGGRNLDARYTLHVRAEVAKEGTESEPNDDPAHASPIAEGLTTGFLLPGDTDVFRFTPPGPASLDLEVTPPDRVNVKLEVLRADGQPLASADEGGRRQPEHLAGVPAAEPVLIRLTAHKGEGNGDEPYQLRVTVHPAGAAP